MQDINILKHNADDIVHGISNISYISSITINSCNAAWNNDTYSPDVPSYVSCDNIICDNNASLIFSYKSNKYLNKYNKSSKS